MKRPPRDEEREQRITMEIVVDAYTPEEQAIGCTTPSRTGSTSRLWQRPSSRSARDTTTATVGLGELPTAVLLLP
jgi:hypothetical protein